MKIIGFTTQQRLKTNSFLILLIFVLLTGCVRQGVYHSVKPGQTLYRISKTYDVDEAYLARINGIPNPTQLRVGTRIFIPGATRTRYVPPTVPGYGTKRSSTVSASRSTPAKPKPVRKPARVKISKKTPPKKVVKRTSTSARSRIVIKLQWPLRGKILRSFGERSQGGGGKGVEIAAREGSKVRAAAAGKVIYSGDGVQGFGHLMILQHENDVFTVYGFNSRNYVKQGQFVSQGERIASSGRPPSGGSGRLHFEVRVGKKAVDPILYLP